MPRTQSPLAFYQNVVNMSLRADLIRRGILFALGDNVEVPGTGGSVTYVIEPSDSVTVLSQLALSGRMATLGMKFYEGVTFTPGTGTEIFGLNLNRVLAPETTPDTKVYRDATITDFGTQLAGWEYLAVEAPNNRRYIDADFEFPIALTPGVCYALEFINPDNPVGEKDLFISMLYVDDILDVLAPN